MGGGWRGELSPELYSKYQYFKYDYDFYKFYI
jgi:hypothetical protein